MKNNSNFLGLNKSERIWAIGSIHSNRSSLNKIHKYILSNFSKNDKIVYLGNIIGVGKESKETLNLVLSFRLFLMSKYYLENNDIVFLRGAQEEMWLKLLQLQIAPNPEEIISWMFEHGVDKTVESYDFDISELKEIISHGTIAISKWTSKLNQKIMSYDGHKEYFSSLYHACFNHSKKILFVNRGVDITRPLSAQNDCFWWGYHNFSKVDKPYKTFNKIVRGYNPTGTNVEDSESIICSLYKGSINDQLVVGGLFSSNGELIDLFES